MPGGTAKGRVNRRTPGTPQRVLRPGLAQMGFSLQARRRSRRLIERPVYRAGRSKRSRCKAARAEPSEAYSRYAATSTRAPTPQMGRFQRPVSRSACSADTRRCPPPRPSSVLGIRLRGDLLVDDHLEGHPFRVDLAGDGGRVQATGAGPIPGPASPAGRSSSTPPFPSASSAPLSSVASTSIFSRFQGSAQAWWLAMSLVVDSATVSMIRR